MVQLGGHHDIEIEEDLLRHMVLNSIRANVVKFKEYCGANTRGVVLACDSRHHWRKDVYPYYKAHRRKARDKSELDWGSIFESINTIKAELRDYFPYRVIEVENAEADDVIGTLVHKYGTVMATGEPILILSGDKDFVQLQVYGNVKQYNPVMKKYIRHKDPVAALKEHIIRGDGSDGIPNFLSADDVFITGGRQKPIMAAKVVKWLLHDDPKDFCDENMLRGWKRNEQLVDLTMTPANIQKQIFVEYENESGKDRSKLFNYFIKRKLKNLMQNINDF